MSTPVTLLNHIYQELDALDEGFVLESDSSLRASQCYHFEPDPLHVLFNTNCPDELKNRIHSIIAKYIPEYESRTSQQNTEA